jgi:hypothetical protein
MTQLSRKEQLEAQLGAVKKLDQLEARRRRSIANTVAKKQEFFDGQRAELLSGLDDALKADLATDPAQVEYELRVEARIRAEEAAKAAAAAAIVAAQAAANAATTGA